MLLFILIFQIENATNKLLDYGLLGIFLFITLYVAYIFYKKMSKDADEWREIAKKQIDHNYETNIEQNRINQKLIDIREGDVGQSKIFQTAIQKKIDELPRHVREELKNELNEQKMNHTSSAGK